MIGTPSMIGRVSKNQVRRSWGPMPEATSATAAKPSRILTSAVKPFEFRMTL